MMKFRTIKQALVSLLGSAEAGRWQTVGAKRQTTAASEVLNDKQVVRVTYDQGDFPAQGSRSSGGNTHDMTFLVLFKVSADSKADLAVINNPSSSAAAFTAAIAARDSASDRADDQMDELFDLVYQVIMARATYDLSQGDGLFDKLQFSGFQKGDPEPQGQLVSLTAQAQITCKTREDVTGDTGTTANSIDTTLDFNEDSGDNAGTENIP